MDQINVLLADNQSFTRQGITSILSNYLNGNLTLDYAKNRIELYEKLVTISPHILIIDFDLFDFRSISELTEIRRLSPCIGILVITDNHSANDIIKVLDCGVTNYILKSCGEQELIEAFNATINNRKYLSSQVLDILLEVKNIIRNSKVSNGAITTSEMEIVRLITQGLTTKEIAIHKKLSYHTIITHRKNIFRKLKINHSSELIIYAMQMGMSDNTEYYI
jgi:DNA-binding NarL/FixJ family response regulator